MPRRQSISEINRTYADYANNISARWLHCFWQKGSFRQCQGDNKATTRGSYSTVTMTTASGEYLVCVYCNHQKFDEFKVTQPTSEHVVTAMRERAAVYKKKTQPADQKLDPEDDD